MQIFRMTLGIIATAAGLILLAPVIILSLPFWLVAFGTRIGSRLLEPRCIAWNEVFAFDDQFGWKPKPNLKVHHLADDVFQLTTDSEGWRGRISLAQSRVVVLGDSFAFGYGIDDDDFFANCTPELQVKAIGSNGYNMVQELMWLEHLAPHLKDKLVVWFIYLGNDLHENLVPDMHGYRMPFLRSRDGNWEITNRHLRPEKWPFTFTLGGGRTDYYEQLARLCVPGARSSRAYRACEYLIQRAKQCCERADARLIVISIPERHQLNSAGVAFLQSLSGNSSLFDPDLPDSQLGAICRSLAIQFVALKGRLNASHYKTHDWHWNRKGHRAVAGILKEITAEHAGRARVRDTEQVPVLGSGLRIAISPGRMRADR